MQTANVTDLYEAAYRSWAVTVEEVTCIPVSESLVVPAYLFWAGLFQIRHRESSLCGRRGGESRLFSASLRGR